MFKFLKTTIYWIRKFILHYVLKDKFHIEVDRFLKIDGDNTIRLEYPDLNTESIVFDVGGFRGDFAEKIYQKFQCYVYIFEPHPLFYRELVDKFSEYEKVKVFNFGLSSCEGNFAISDSVDGSSFDNPNIKSKNVITCSVKNIVAVIRELSITQIDLMKINIEGGEYELLNALASANLLKTCVNYQIQFHNFIKESKSKRDHLHLELAKTHKLDWNYEFVWENWSQR